MQSKKMKKISSEREVRVRSCPLIIAIVIAAIGAIFTARDDEDYRIYNCYDRYFYKCLKCRKKCEYHDMAKKVDQLNDAPDGGVK